MRTPSSTAFRPDILRAGAAALSGLLTGGLIAFATLPAPAQAAPASHGANRGMESAHQPVVERTDFVFDVAADPAGSLSAAERQRLVSWFRAIDMGFGDRVAIAGAGGYDFPALREAIGDEVAHYGLLIGDQAPRTAGVAGSGALRVVISRATAHVPGCPDWNDRSETNLHGGTSANYGCATNMNLAAMVADPQDLIQGRTTHTVLRTATSGRAIKAYSEQAPTGAGGLKAEAVGGR